MAAGFKLMADKDKGSVSCPIEPLPHWRRAPGAKLCTVPLITTSFPGPASYCFHLGHLQNAFAVAEVTFQLTFVSGTLGGLLVLLHASNRMLVVVCAG